MKFLKNLLNLLFSKLITNEIFAKLNSNFKKLSLLLNLRTIVQLKEVISFNGLIVIKEYFN